VEAPRGRPGSEPAETLLRDAARRAGEHTRRSGPSGESDDAEGKAGRSGSAKGARGVRGALRRVSAEARATSHASETPA
jgi:hypothetical protein